MTKPWHHLDNGRFRNPKGSPFKDAGLRDYVPFMTKMIRGQAKPIDVPENHVVPRDVAKRNLEDALTNHEQPNFLTWLGHASFLFKLGGLTFITDPYLSSFAGPRNMGPRRYVPSGVAIKDLPPIDVLLISHNHYDHLDEVTLKRLPNKDKIHVIAPLRLGDFFRKRGFSMVTELDWDQSITVGGAQVTALPVVHWSRRKGFDTNRTLWCGFAVRDENHHLFFGGDSAYGPIFKEIGHRYGPFDTALLGIGAYAPRKIMKASHASPEEAVQMGIDLQARRLVGMHWGTVVLTSEPPFEPPDRFLKHGCDKGYSPDDLWIMKIGETRSLSLEWPHN